MNEKIYPHSKEFAQENNQMAAYQESNEMNKLCAKAIDTAIQESNYELYHYDLKTAFKSVTEEYSSDRVNWVLASAMQDTDHDGRFSDTNRNWGAVFNVPDEQRRGYYLETHPAILGGFINIARKEHIAKTKENSEQRPSIVEELKSAKEAVENTAPKDRSEKIKKQKGNRNGEKNITKLSRRIKKTYRTTRRRHN